MGNNITDLIIQNLSFLIEAGFKFSSNIRVSSFDKNKKIEELLYKKNNIQVEVSFRKFIDCKILNITIEKINENLSFGFDEYLIFKGNTKDSYLGDLGESDETYIRKFCTLFEKAVNDDLLDVLEGKKWIEIPKDYSRMR